MILEQLTVGPLQTNTYIIGDGETGKAMVVDPGDEPDRIIDLIRAKHLTVEYIVCTHAHFDHIGAVGDIKRETGAKILLHRNDLETYGMAKDQAVIWGFSVDDLPQPDGFIDEGDEIHVGKLSFRILSTPGHSPGGICLYGGQVLLSGDTIFQGSVGRTDFPGGSIADLKKSFRRILDLPDDTAILSGHGPGTTVRREKKENFFLHEL